MLINHNLNKFNDWDKLSTNPGAIELLKENPDKIVWNFLSINSNPEAIKLLKSNPDKINWSYLSLNPNAIELLKANPENIIWDDLSENPNAIELLEANTDKINWFNFSYNTSIFTYDYDLIKKNFKDLGEEIIQKALHPKRMLRLMQEYGEDDVYKYYFDEE